MQLQRPSFTVRIKSLHDLLPSASATALAVSLSKPLQHCRSCFISRFFGSVEDGTKSSALPDSTIHFSLESVLEQGPLPFSFFSKKVARSQRFPQSWRVARRSWPSRGCCFFARHHHGNGLRVWLSPSSDCFCYASDLAFAPDLRTQCDVHFVRSCNPM
jgi:hypothetical protein